jgi:Fe-S-cluster containining protein
MCCRDYHVVLNIHEWIKIVRNYGVNSTIFSRNNLLLGKKSDGSCCFLNYRGDTCYCGLQYMKPLACKIWPFKILDYPKFGDSTEAFYRFRERNFFIYVDSECAGLSWGQPTFEFKNKLLPEFIGVALGVRKKQMYSTSNLRLVPSYNLYRPRNLI